MKVIIDKIGDENFRIAIINNNGILQDLHYSSSANQMRGNIYLGYITRIESSLQAAFVDYGNIKNGFLPFAEVNLEDYNISNKEKQRLYKEEEANRESKVSEAATANTDEGLAKNAFEIEPLLQINENQTRNFKFYRKYRIQDVLEVGQIVLAQVIKEERGNKGVTLSTYIGLPGRLCTLLPNTQQKSKISNQIVNENLYNNLEQIIEKLSIPHTMSVIIRNTGAQKSLNEIRDEYTFLLKEWQKIESLFVKNLIIIKEKHNNLVRPKLLYSKTNIIGDFFRDHWSENYHTVVVASKALHTYTGKISREILKKDTPKITFLNNKIPIFTYFNIERQIAELYHNTVQLKSGGHIVINKTEALVAIDINSGRMTAERDVEDTAFKINIEAIAVIVRQIRLRELSGILILDFIDMMDTQNRKTVEQELYNELIKNDTAKIKISRISPLGLVEMSRQRLRSSFQEIFTNICYICNGRGHVRNIYETGFAIIRAIETDFFLNELTINKESKITCTVSTNNNIAIHLLNEERNNIIEIENKLNIKVKIIIDNKMYQDMFNIHFIDINSNEKDMSCVKNNNSNIKQLTTTENQIEEEVNNDSNEYTIFGKIIKKWINKIIN